MGLVQICEEGLGAHTGLHLLTLDNGLMAVKDIVTGAQTYSRTAIYTKIRVKSIWAELDQAQYTEHDIRVMQDNRQANWNQSETRLSTHRS